jgi:protein phosphatase
VVSHDTLEQTMAAGRDPASTCEQLVQLALRSGAPDNVTCIVADVVDTAAASTETVPLVVGAAAQRPQPRTRRPGEGATPAERAAELTSDRPTPEAPGAPDDEEPSPAARTLHRVRLGGTVLAVAVVLGLGGFGAYRWSQGQFFVGDDAGAVAVYRGLPQNLGPITLSSVRTTADVQVSDLPLFFQRQVREGIVADDEAAAGVIVTRLRAEALACVATRTPAATPTATPSSGPSSAASPKAAVKGTATPVATPTTGPTSTPTTSASPGAGTPAEGCQGLG